MILSQKFHRFDQLECSTRIKDPSFWKDVLVVGFCILQYALKRSRKGTELLLRPSLSGL